MSAYLEVSQPHGVELVALESDRVTIGRATSNDVTLLADGKASRLHAVLERLPAGWCIRDLSSHNGTFVNRERVDRDRPLHGGDEIRVGRTLLVFRSDSVVSDRLKTEGPELAPEVSPREREVLLALFRPALSGAIFAEPASTREIATALSVSEAAVKQHLLRLYDKFGIYEGGERRRVRLANEALLRGAVTLADVRNQHARARRE
jgi:DNA-binding CsgD family transcriptional regulator